MTNIASLNFSDVGMPTTEPAPSASGTCDQPFDELLACLAATAPVASPPAALTAMAPNPGALFSTVPTLSPDSEMDVVTCEPAESVGGKDDSEVADDAEGDATSPPSPEDDVTVLSSCLAMWQVLPPPTSLPLPAPSGEEISAPEIGIGKSEPAMETGEASAARTSSVALAPLAASAPAFSLPVGEATLPVGAPVSEPGPVEEPMPTGGPLPAAPSAPQGGPEVSPAQNAAPAPADVPVIAAVVAKEPASTRPMSPGPSRVVSSRQGTESVKIRPTQTASPAPQILRSEADGIPDAKEQRVMRDPAFQPSSKIAPAAFAEGETPVKATTEAVVETVQPAGSAGKSPLEDQGQDGMSGDHREQGMNEFVTPTAGREIHPGIEVRDRDSKSVSSDATQVIQHIERAVERMRTQGGERVEMRVPLHDGGEVVVKLQMEQGHLKATFRTDSEGMQQALETGWSQFSQTSSDRGVRVGPPVFDSSSSQNGMGSFQQSPDQRERGANARLFETEFAAPPRTPEGKKPLEPRRSASSGSLQIYA